MIITTQPQEFRIFNKHELHVSLCTDEHGRLFLRFAGNFLLTVDFHRSDIRQAHIIELWQESETTNSPFSATVFRKTVESIVLRTKELLAKHDESTTTLWSLVERDILHTISQEKRKYLEDQFFRHNQKLKAKKTG